MTSEVDREGLAAILARLEAATGADRELDAWITWATVAPAGAEVVIGPVTGEIRIRTGKGSFTGQDIVWPEWPTWRDAKPTASIDAAVALAERTLPLSSPEYEVGDYTFDVLRAFDGQYKVRLFRSGGEARWGSQPQANAPTLPLALCTALCRTLLARLDATPSPE